MIKTVGLLQRREGLDATGFREHYEQNHAPMATKLLEFSGYQRNYPESDRARDELGLDGFSEFWFQDAAETSRIGELMQGDIGALFVEDELRFMNRPANQSYEVTERLYGARPAPGKSCGRSRSVGCPWARSRELASGRSIPTTRASARGRSPE